MLLQIKPRDRVYAGLKNPSKNFMFEAAPTRSGFGGSILGIQERGIELILVIIDPTKQSLIAI